nr:MAG TPA: hypothetical protein [Bacteriophage sp.]
MSQDLTAPTPSPTFRLVPSNKHLHQDFSCTCIV